MRGEEKFRYLKNRFITVSSSSEQLVEISVVRVNIVLGAGDVKNYIFVSDARVSFSRDLHIFTASTDSFVNA